MKKILRRCQAFAGTDNTDTIMRIATMKRAAMLFVVLLLNVHVYAQLDKAVKKILSGDTIGKEVSASNRDSDSVRLSNLQKELEEARLRSEEHKSELQLRQYLVCRLLLEKK